MVLQTRGNARTGGRMEKEVHAGVCRLSIHTPLRPHSMVTLVSRFTIQ
jgi:hypothetical protein